MYVCMYACVCVCVCVCVYVYVYIYIYIYIYTHTHTHIGAGSHAGSDCASNPGCDSPVAATREPAKDPLTRAVG